MSYLFINDIFNELFKRDISTATSILIPRGSIEIPIMAGNDRSSQSQSQANLFRTSHITKNIVIFLQLYMINTDL